MAAQTIITISTSGAEYPFPGTHWTPEMVVSSLSSVVSGIGSMQSEVTMNGENKNITFRPRSGTKG